MSAIAVAAFAATLTWGSTAGARDLPPIKTVGVISDVGDKVALKHIGFTVFRNTLTHADVPEWKIDDFIIGEIEGALKARYEPLAVTYEKGKIAPDVENAIWSTPSPDDNVRANAKPAGEATIDAYIVVWPRKSEVFPTNQTITGLGVLERGRATAIYAALELTLLDGRTGKKIDRCSVRTPDGDINNMREQREFAAVENLDALTPEQKQMLEQSLKSLVRDGLAFCLKDVKLLP